MVLLRLAAKLNNGKEHFDHGPQGASWLCLACHKQVVSGALSTDHRLRVALQTARDFIVAHPAVQGEWPLLVGVIDSALKVED